MTNRKIVQETVNTVTNEEGEVKSETSTRTGYVSVEPAYVKIYLADLLRLTEIPKNANGILLCILRRMNFDHNDVILIAPIKNQIAKELGISLVSVAKAIDLFADKSILLRQARGYYLVNPYFFGKGHWDKIEKIRLTIEYSAKGRMIMKTEFTGRETEENFSTRKGEWHDQKVQGDSEG